MGIVREKKLADLSTQKLLRAALSGMFLLTPTIGHAATTMEPGLWEVVISTSGMMGMPPRNMTTKHCIKPEDLKKPEDLSPDMSAMDMSCSKHNVKESGNTVTWQITCKNSDMEMEGAGTFVSKSPQAYEGKTSMAMKIAGMDDIEGMAAMTYEMKTSFSGRRLGSCK